MNLKSIRWQLPISYAAIALLAALSLGAVLLFTLRSYYARLEQQYLVDNAGSIGFIIGQSLREGASSEDIQDQIDSLTFLSEIHIDVYDASGSLMAASPEPENIMIMVKKIEEDAQIDAVAVDDDDADTSVYNIESQLVDAGDENIQSGITMRIGREKTDSDVVTFIRIINQDEDGMAPLNSIAIGRKFSEKDFNGEMPDSAHLSDQSIRQTFFDESGTLLGSIELSEGPTYGMEIINTVARGWLTASLLAVLIAGGVGVFISLKITTPLGVLTDTTTRMAQGQLSMRANIHRQDEIGSLARSFNEMADQVQSTIQTLRRFVADAAHELQTPITALTTDLELALDDLPGGSKSKIRSIFLPRALTQAERLKNLAASLLDLSRLEAGEKEKPHQPVDVSCVVAGLSESWAARAEQAGIEFCLDNCPQAAFVSGNENQLCQAFDNLVDNALKFTPAGGSVRVCIAVDDELVFMVADTGIGIPEQDVEQLFSRFHRGCNTAAYAGNGLGLAIVKAIVEQHGGSVEYQDGTPGAVFYLRLPRLPEQKKS